MIAKLRIFAAAICAVASVVVGHAQTTTTTHYGSVDDLPGIDINQVKISGAGKGSKGEDRYRPGADNTTLQQRDSIYMLYNVGQHKFLYSGARFGTEAVLGSVPHYIWFEEGSVSSATWPDVKANTTFKPLMMHMNFMTNNQATTTSNGYFHYDTGGRNGNGDKGFFISGAIGTTWNKKDFIFYRVNGYGANNYVYRICAVEGDSHWCLAYNSSTQSVESNYGINNADAYWKIIPLSQYYELANASTAEMKEPMDITTIMKDPGFHINNYYIKNWQITDKANSKMRFGTLHEWKNAPTIDNDTEYHLNGTGKMDGNYQRSYGSDYYAYTVSPQHEEMYQDVIVHANGWYIISCQGFSTANTTDNSNAFLFAGFVNKTSSSSSSSSAKIRRANNVGDASEALRSITGIRYQPLNPITPETVSTLSGDNDNDGHLIGQAFKDGQYPNQVLVHVTGLDRTTNKSATLRLGLYINSHSASSTENTSVGAFRAAYAGETNTLLLDENDYQLDTLANTRADFTHATMLLKRTFTPNKWNTIVLPVSLTKAQVQDAFGSDVQVAKLAALTNNTIRYYRVEPATDDATMIEAFVPYIILPSKEPSTNPGATDEWPNEEGEATTRKHVRENHYSFPFITFDQTTLNSKKGNIQWDKNGTTEWLSAWNGEGHEASLDGTTLTAYGTLAATYDVRGVYATGNARIRTHLANAYYMKNGEMWQVPSNMEYGLKGFRVYFMRTDPKQAKPNVYVDDNLIIDGGSTTGINNILAWQQDNGIETETRSYVKRGIYNINGQRISDRADTSSLKPGLYIIDGVKVVVR